MKELKVVVRDKHTLELNEDGSKGDIIDLNNLENIDFTVIESLISEGKDQIYLKKQEELRKTLNEEKIKELEILRLNLLNQHKNEVNKLNQEISNFEANKKIELSKLTNHYEAEINLWKAEVKSNAGLFEEKLEKNTLELNNKHQAEIALLKQELSNYEINKQLEMKKMEDSFLLEIQKYQSLVKTNAGIYEEKLTNIKLELENKYHAELALLKEQLANLKPDYEKELLKKDNEYAMVINSLKLGHAEEVSALNKAIADQELRYQELQHRKASLGVKNIGEELETWCNNEMESYMQNGFSNCEWIKDNKVVKDEGEAKGSKADYIFKIYATPECKEEELLAGVCLDMKDENPNSVNKKKNADYYKDLDKNRNKKGCKYAVLVSNLEADNVNDLPIFKVKEYQDMYVVRPAYMVVLLNMITSLTTNFKDLLLAANQEKLEIKAKTDLLEAFEALKKTYLEKGIESLESNVNNIKKKSAAIIQSAEEVENICNKIITDYILSIQNKLDTFQLKMEREYRKYDKQNKN